MTRFQIHLVGVAVVGGLALVCHNFTLLGLTLLASFLVIVLGVWNPGLRIFGPFICRGNPSRKQVALTFDDGPDPVSTPVLLDLLRELKLPAAFFVIGKHVEAHPELTARIVREGHLVANHSFRHSYATNFFTVAQLTDDLTKAQAAIEKAVGQAPTLFRPPMGLSNPNVFAVAKKMRFQVIGWTARGFDTQIKSSDWVVKRIMRQLQPGGIILLHDGDIPADRLVVTLKLLLAKLQAHGYEIVRLDQILT
ncbi:MAG: polysaccharide deacetylase family protein [Verrucomicrobiota bacterium]